MNIYPIVQLKMHKKHRPSGNLTSRTWKKKIKLAREKIDKVLNIWILLIHKEYISTLYWMTRGKKSNSHAKNIVLYLRFSDNDKPPWI